ncbi:hypothetical protein ACGFYQ_31260 [Streptomyces sp. NPDC048258]|uniref:hypothetical protein n=1 Tax=Streptomyces sp. NPDC048258 TaxID=3365527 RepID=UPI00371B2AF9
MIDVQRLRVLRAVAEHGSFNQSRRARRSGAESPGPIRHIGVAAPKVTDFAGEADAADASELRD